MSFLALALLVSSLPYDPSQALARTDIQKKQFALNPSELEVLKKHGLVIANSKHPYAFATGYRGIYAADLPVYVTADALMHVVYESHDDILMAVELRALIPELRAMLGEMRKSLSGGAAASFGDDAAKGADEYCAIALSLLDGKLAQPIAGGDAKRVKAIVDRITAAKGPGKLEVFGASNDEDFSLYKPRGHYTKSPQLEHYFRAMMFLGHGELRLFDENQVKRGAIDGALALRKLISGGGTRDRWTAIDQTVAAFAGEADGMSLPDLERFASALGDPSSWREVSNDAIAAELKKTRGKQRIQGHPLVNDGTAATRELPISFFLFPQRYTIDSDIFTRLTYDRLPVKRMMPDPLDLGYAVLGNDVAKTLLAGELARFPYGDELAKARASVDGMDGEYWSSSLYGLWLYSLRGLTAKESGTLPSIASTEAWQRRLLNTQLASWAELRHNNVLYAKQSMTMSIACEFPDAYVEPYPEFFDRLAAFAGRGERVLRTLSKGSVNLSDAVAHYTKLREVSTKLAGIARTERAGKPLSKDDMKFINLMIDMKGGGGCGGPPEWSGWYAELHFDRGTIDEFEPPIVDVHTQPTDEHGNPVGRVLHVASGEPRIMVVTIDAGGPPRAFVGVVSSYHEKVTGNFQRLDDAAWKLLAGAAEDPVWMKDLVVR